jgi:hypothetical protein
MHGKVIDAYRSLVIKPEGRRALGTNRNGWKNNIKISFKK